MTSNKNNEWLNEFSEFSKESSATVPAELSQKVLRQMDELMSPKPSLIFAKVSVVHFIVGFLSLAVCHQFDMNPFNTETSLTDYFMMYGHNFCMFACGILFMAGSLATAGFFLSTEEVRVLRKNELLQTTLLSVISLMAFAVIGAELALTFALLWLVGGLIGGLLTTEIIWQLKKVRVSA